MLQYYCQLFVVVAVPGWFDYAGFLVTLTVVKVLLKRGIGVVGDKACNGEY